MPTVSYSIANTADDVTESSVAGLADTGVANGSVTSPFSYQARVGLRFLGIAVPQGATIDDAKLSLKNGSAPVGSPPFGIIKGVAADNAPAWTTTGPIAASKTTQSVTISSAATVDYNVTAIVQAIVNRSGWSSGNALAFAGDLTGATGVVSWTDYADNPADAAQLSITYSTGGGTAYTLTAAAGSFTLSGRAAGLKRSRSLSAASRAFTLTGRSALLTRGRRYIANAGTFSLVGQSAGLKAQRAITGGAGAVALTGFAVGLRVTRVLLAAPRAYVLSGQPALFETGKKLVGSPGAFALSGKAVNLVFSRRLPAEVGAFVLNGQDAALDLVRKMGSEAGAFVITGADVGLKLGRRLPVEAGQYVLAGSDAGFVLDQGGNATLSAEQGVFVMAFGQASFRVSGWSPVPPASETWTTVPKASETWTPVPKTPEVWS